MNSKNHFKEFTDEQIENLLKQAYRNVYLDAIKEHSPLQTTCEQVSK